MDNITPLFLQLIHTATGVALSNGLSPDVVFVSADAGQRICYETVGTVICNLDTIASGATIPVIITVRPDEGQTRFPTEGKSITNVAFVIANEIDSDETNNSDTESTNALPNPNAPPTVQIETPAADAIMTGLATFDVIVKASDAGGSISQVELFDNGESVGTGTIYNSPPYYSVARNNVAFGEHYLIAVATDNGGRKAISKAVKFFVNGSAVVTLDSPAENDLFGRPANIPFTATATNQSGSIAQVEFLANGESVGNGVLSGANQYNLTWNNAPTGTHSVRAVATDGNGVKSYSYPAKITVTNAPIVSITSPATGASYPKNSDITFIANARDFDGYVSNVQFFANGTELVGEGILIQGNTYTFTWASVPVGTRTITAVAIDNSGKTSISNPVNITVTNNPPTVSMTSPTNGATFTTPANITLTADAADSDGAINYVEFFDGTTLIGQSNYAPYNLTWNNVVIGNHILTVKATDDDGATSVSSPVTITVNAAGDALLVVGNTTLNSVDTAIRTRLQNLGLNVVIKSATSAVSADATGKRVVIISDTVSPTNVNTKFRAIAVPVVTLDPQLFDDMGMTATTSGNFGTTSSQKNVTISNASHPMAAGLSGTVQVTSANTTFGWGKINANGLKIATLTTDTTKATSFGYETNAVMPGLTAPRRRVGFFYTASSSALTVNGGLLFDNAIKWAAGL